MKTIHSIYLPLTGLQVSTRIMLSCLFMQILTICSVHANQYWVSSDINIGDNAHPGTYADPFLTIQHALNIANSGDEVILRNDAAFIISLPIVWPLEDGITLKSGYAPDPILRSVITSNNLCRIIEMVNLNPSDQLTNQTHLKDLVLAGGSTLGLGNGGGMLMIGYVAPLLENIAINACTADGHNGGGIYYEPYNNYLYTSNCYYWENIIPPCVFLEVSIDDCSSKYGGAMYIKGNIQTNNPLCPEIDVNTAVMEIYASDFYRNNAELDGGGIYLEGSYIICNESRFATNSSGLNGGGIYSFLSRTEMAVCEFTENKSENGGAVYFFHGISNKDNCDQCVTAAWDNLEHNWQNIRLYLNEADQNGGGYYFDGGNVNKFENYLDFREYAGSITDGIAGDNGGAICVTQTTNLDLFNIDISNNSATNGGGIYNDCNWSTSTNSGNNGEHHFEQLLITSNDAYDYGGGIFTRQSFSCINSTIVANGSTRGGAIAVASFSGPSGNVNVTPVVMNSILYGNTIDQVYLDDNNCIPQFFNCDIQSYLTALDFGFTIGTPPTTWMDYGWTDLNNLPIGNTMIEALPNFIGNFQLSSGSPCRDTGYDYMCKSNLYPGFSYGYIPFPWGTDFDGQIRFNGVIDIGAKEYQTKSAWIDPAHIADPTRISLVTVKPNPWNKRDELSILLSNPEYYLTNIKLFNAYGQQLIDRNTEQANSIKLNMQDFNILLKPGIYVMKVEYMDSSGNNYSTTKKIIIL